jgi:hypothetical protein
MNNERKENMSQQTQENKVCQFGEDCEPATCIYINETDDSKNKLTICKAHADAVYKMCTEDIECEIVKLTPEEYEAYKLLNV